MNELYFKFNDELLYLRHNGISKDRKTLLFIHGLGDSGISFEDVFNDRRFDDYNIIVPDLVGYGRSSGSLKKDGYSFDSHLERLRRLIREKNLNELIVIGHSMGGDLATLLCESDSLEIIKKYISIEGDLTQHDLFISYKAVKAYRKGNFEHWFKEEFVDRIIYEGLGHLRSGRLYYASIRFCRPEAFLANSIELVKRNTSLLGKYKSEIGEIYRSLTVPKILCYGTKSLAKETLAFLKENKLAVKAFEGAGHCPMTDKTDEFYSYLYNFIQQD